MMFDLLSQDVFLTVLKMGGVSMGSFWSKIMDALASILGRGPSSCLARTVKVTKPCPVVPLFGGRKPTLGSAGASPVVQRYLLKQLQRINAHAT